MNHYPNLLSMTKKSLFLLLFFAVTLISCNNDESNGSVVPIKNEVKPSTEVFVQGQYVYPVGTRSEVTVSNSSTRAEYAYPKWPLHTNEGYDIARFSLRADGTIPGVIDQSSSLYFGRSPGKQGNNRGRVSNLFTYNYFDYGHYDDRGLDYYMKDKKTGDNEGLFRYILDEEGQKTQLAILEAPKVSAILGDEVADLQAEIESGLAAGKNVTKAQNNLNKVNALLALGDDYLESHVLWYVVKEVGMQYGWHVNGIISDNTVPVYTFDSKMTPDNVYVDVHQQQHNDWNEIKTSIHIRTACESVKVTIPLDEEDILEQDDFAIRVFDYDISSYTISNTVTHDANGITISITNIPGELIQNLKDNFGDGLTIEIHSYTNKSDIWDKLQKSYVTTGKSCMVNGQTSTAIQHDGEGNNLSRPIYVKPTN